MWWDEHIIVSLLVLSIVSTILAAGCIPFIMNQVTGWSKFCLGLHLACRLDFGHACGRWFVFPAPVMVPVPVPAQAPAAGLALTAPAAVAPMMATKSGLITCGPI